MVLWQNRPVEQDDFLAIRTYVDACLKSYNDDSPINQQLTSNYEILLELINTLEEILNEHISCILDLPKPIFLLPPSTLPIRVKLPIPLKPKKPDTLQKFKYPNSFFNSYNSIILKIKKIEQKRGNPNRPIQDKHLKLLSKKESMLKLLPLASQWAKCMAEWVEAKDDQKHGNARAIKDFNSSKQFHDKVNSQLIIMWLFTKIAHTLKTNDIRSDNETKYKILSRVRRDINKVINNDGLTYITINWKLLPEGQPLASAINSYIAAAIRNHPTKTYEESRITKILSLKPNKAYIGQSEFDGYIVFLFNYSPYAVLECPWFGNALYLLNKDNWASLSKFTKSTLLHHQSKHARRIIHDPDGNWFRRLKRQIHP